MGLCALGALVALKAHFRNQRILVSVDLRYAPKQKHQRSAFPFARLACPHQPGTFVSIDRASRRRIPCGRRQPAAECDIGGRPGVNLRRSATWEDGPASTCGGVRHGFCQPAAECDLSISRMWKRRENSLVDLLALRSVQIWNVALREELTLNARPRRAPPRADGPNARPRRAPPQADGPNARPRRAPPQADEPHARSCHPHGSIPFGACMESECYYSTCAILLAS